MAKPHSQSVEDYLKAIHALSGTEGHAVTTGQIAKRLGVSQPSATNMVKRLAGAGLVRHSPYRAVTLTGEGKARAADVVRRHRLWELYLKNVLGLPLERVHGEAEQLEHALSETLADRLDEILGYPNVDPHGEPIPGRRIA